MTELALRQMDAPSHDSAVPGAEPYARPTLPAFALVRDFARFEALEAEWNALFDAHGRSEQVFQSFAWCWHWARHYLARDDRKGPSLAIVTGRQDGRLVLILPLVTDRTAGLTELAWMGEPVSQYGDLIAAPEASSVECLGAAWSFARNETGADLARLRKVREGSLADRLISQLGGRVTATEEAPYIDLAAHPDVASYEATLTAKSRRNRRRYLRRLEDVGPFAFETETGTQAAGARARQAIQLKRQQLAAKDQIALALADERFENFFHDAVEGCGKPAGVIMRTLSTNGQIAAMQIAIASRGNQFLHVAVYSPEFENLGVGGLLLERAIADCHRAGVATFDMLLPKHGYKMDFTDKAVRVHDHAIALSLAGRFYANGALSIRRKVKGAIESLPAPVRRLVAAGITRLATR